MLSKDWFTPCTIISYKQFLVSKDFYLSPCRVVLFKKKLYCPIVSLIDIYETDKSYHIQHLQSLSFVKSYFVRSSTIMSVKNSFGIIKAISISKENCYLIRLKINVKKGSNFSCT